MKRLILEYLPPVLQEVRDFRCLMGEYQGIFEELWELEQETEDNFYLETANVRGIVHWETILGIIPREGSTVGERRQMIVARLSQTTPYCWRTFLAFLTALMGTEQAYEASLSGLTLTVWIMPNWRWMRGAVWDLMQWVVPANIEMRLLNVYNTHGQFRALTHGEMRAWTHRKLRSEVDLG